MKSIGFKNEKDKRKELIRNCMEKEGKTDGSSVKEKR